MNGNICFLSILLLVNYAAHVHGYVNEWRKNPQWSFSCCLALVLPLIALPGEISSLSKTNVLRTQLDSGQMELGTLTDAVKECGVIDVSLEEDENKEEDEEESSAGTQDQQDNPSGNSVQQRKRGARGTISDFVGPHYCGSHEL